jgi:hypothetical protein
LRDRQRRVLDAGVIPWLRKYQRHGGPDHPGPAAGRGAESVAVGAEGKLSWLCKGMPRWPLRSVIEGMFMAERTHGMAAPTATATPACCADTPACTARVVPYSKPSDQICMSCRLRRGAARKQCGARQAIGIAPAVMLAVRHSDSAELPAATAVTSAIRPVMSICFISRLSPASPRPRRSRCCHYKRADNKRRRR